MLTVGVSAGSPLRDNLYAGRETWVFLVMYPPCGMSRFDVEFNLAAVVLEISCREEVSPHDMQELGRTKILDPCSASGSSGGPERSDGSPLSSVHQPDVQKMVEPFQGLGSSVLPGPGPRALMGPSGSLH